MILDLIDPFVALLVGVTKSFSWSFLSTHLEICLGVAEQNAYFTSDSAFSRLIRTDEWD